MKRQNFETTNSKSSEKKSSKKSSKKKKKVDTPLTEQQKLLLVQIETRLRELNNEFPVKCVDIRKNFTAKDILDCKQSLAKSGAIFFKNALTDVNFELCKSNFVQAFENMFGEILSEEQKIAIRTDISNMDQYRNSKNGFGNSSFGYLSKQFVKKDLTPKSTLPNGEEIFLAHNACHSKVNLQLLANDPHLAAILLAMTHIDGMVSWDCTKFASNPRPKPKTMTEQDLTKVHFDVYGGEDAVSEGDRYQVLIVREEKIKLGYVPHSHDPTIQKLIATYLGKPNFFSRRGFIGISDKHLIKIFEKEWIAPPTNSMVMWMPTVIHFEAEASEIVEEAEFHKFVSNLNLGNQTRWRFVVGVHKPQNLSREDLVELARLSEHDIIPDFYFNINKGKKVFANIKNAKTTQWKIPREQSEAEKQHFLTTISSRATDQTFEKLHPLKKHLHGVTQSLENCGFSQEDLELLLQLK